MKKIRWAKKNLVTLKGGGDIYKCSQCKYEKKYIVLGSVPPDCPKCTGKELAEQPPSWWSSLNPSKCQCGRVATIVPRTGHPLSEYWKYERPGEFLWYCPDHNKPIRIAYE